MDDKMSNWEKLVEMVSDRASKGLLTTVLISADVYWRWNEDVRSEGVARVTVEVFDKTEMLWSFSYVNKIGVAASKYHLGYDFAEYLRNKLAQVAEVVEDEVIAANAVYAIALEIRPKR